MSWLISFFCRFTFSNENKVTITVLNYGCIIYQIKTPDKKGEVVDVNLGFDNLKGKTSQYDETSSNKNH